LSKGVQIAGGATLVALLLGGYAWSNLQDGASFTYYQNLAEFRASGGALRGERARVHGYVATGSIERDVSGRSVRFLVQERPPHAAGAVGDPLPVVYASLETPDLFKDGAEVVVEGRLAEGAVFHADKVMAKCPSKFRAEDAEPGASARGGAQRS
jgi:cytochrome c-type biogenesis protein CcmE